jgi:hypothetical protein
VRRDASGPRAYSDLGERETFVRGTLEGAATLAGALVVGLALWGRLDWALGFAVGALVNLGNFHLIARAVCGMAGLGGERPLGVFWKGALFRFAAAGAALVVALLVFHVSLPALVAGLVITQVTMIALWLVRALRSLN